jgi:hypothetical protein
MRSGPMETTVLGMRILVSDTSVLIDLERGVIRAGRGGRD